MTRIFLLSFVFIGLTAFFQILWARFARKPALISLAARAGAFSFLLLQFFAGMHGNSERLLSAFFAVSFWCTYVLVLVAARNSVTLRIMDEIAASPGISAKALAQHFPTEEGLNTRIFGMAQSGFVRLIGPEEFELSFKARLIAVCARALQKLFAFAQPG